jgi:hypothetical protein
MGVNPVERQWQFSRRRGDLICFRRMRSFSLFYSLYDKRSVFKKDNDVRKLKQYCANEFGVTDFVDLKINIDRYQSNCVSTVSMIINIELR